MIAGWPHLPTKCCMSTQAVSATQLNAPGAPELSGRGADTGVCRFLRPAAGLGGFCPSCGVALETPVPVEAASCKAVNIYALGRPHHLHQLPAIPLCPMVKQDLERGLYLGNCESRWCNNLAKSLVRLLRMLICRSCYCLGLQACMLALIFSLLTATSKAIDRALRHGGPFSAPPAPPCIIRHPTLRRLGIARLLRGCCFFCYGWH